MNRQAATMANPAVAAQIHQALDVHADFTTKITFNRELVRARTGSELVPSELEPTKQNKNWNRLGSF